MMIAYYPERVSKTDELSRKGCHWSPGQASVWDLGALPKIRRHRLACAFSTTLLRAIVAYFLDSCLIWSQRTCPAILKPDLEIGPFRPDLTQRICPSRPTAHGRAKWQVLQGIELKLMVRTILMPGQQELRNGRVRSRKGLIESGWRIYTSAFYWLYCSPCCPYQWRRMSQSASSSPLYPSRKKLGVTSTQPAPQTPSRKKPLTAPVFSAPVTPLPGSRKKLNRMY